MGKNIDLGFKTPTDLYPFDEPFAIYSPTRSTPSTGTSSKPRGNEGTFESIAPLLDAQVERAKQKLEVE